MNMQPFDIGENQLEYQGSLVTPLFVLLSNRTKVVADLYNALLGLHSGITSFSFTTGKTGAIAPTLDVDLNAFGTYHLASEEIQWRFPDAWTYEWRPTPLMRADAWLRSAVPNLTFENHVFTYEAHGSLLNGDARGFLLGLGGPVIEGLGVDDGTGLIFHFRYPSHGWYVHLLVDHSHVQAGGLFIQMVTTIEGGAIGYDQTVSRMRDLFCGALGRLGLEIVTGVG
ncbi:MAG TPA: hypothetical protein VEY93_00590 [Longimicrobium sp.]|nr:hypothetical protein [Longimicrobium sp.]